MTEFAARPVRTVWKWPLTQMSQLVHVPKGAEFLDVQMQPVPVLVDGVEREAVVPVVWALVDPQAEQEDRQFEVIGTGHEFVYEGQSYVGTFQSPDGKVVWHVFEVLRVPDAVPDPAGG